MAHWLRWWTCSTSARGLCMCLVARSNPAVCITLCFHFDSVVITTNKVRGWNNASLHLVSEFWSGLRVIISLGLPREIATLPAY